MGHFLQFDHPDKRKTQNFEKLKKKKNPGDIIILHLCTTSDDHMMYGSKDIKCNRHNFCHFGLFFDPRSLLTTHNIKYLKELKKLLEIL